LKGPVTMPLEITWTLIVLGERAESYIIFPLVQYEENMFVGVNFSWRRR